jgi:Sulfotransferase domain
VTQPVDPPKDRAPSPIALPTDWASPPPGLWTPPPPGFQSSVRGRVHRLLRQSLPAPAYQFVRKSNRQLRRALRRSPGYGRLLPDYLIIGVAKGGTTTLAAWLNEHPFVVPAALKEVHYFDYQFSFGEDWYRSHFPREQERRAFASEHGRPFLTGEASPSYISHMWAPARIAQALPDVKLIVALRNPVERAYSQFQMSRRAELEPFESFHQAIVEEDERLKPELARVAADPTLRSGRLGAWSYLLRGRYAEQLEHWFNLFPRDQFHFVKTEDLASRPAEALADLHRFLGLPEYEREAYPDFHVGQYAAMPAETRTMLVEYFKPLNERLYELVGIDFGWEAEAGQSSGLLVR